MERISVTIDDDLLADFDLYMEKKGYRNRSEGIRDAIRQLLADERLKEDDTQPCVGCVVYMYNHQERTLSSRLVEAQHHHHDIPQATLHLHVDAKNCLEATVLNGTVGEVRHMADHLISQTGVKYGHLHIIPTEEES